MPEGSALPPCQFQHSAAWPLTSAFILIRRVTPAPLGRWQRQRQRSESRDCRTSLSSALKHFTGPLFCSDGEHFHSVVVVSSKENIRRPCGLRGHLAQHSAATVAEQVTLESPTEFDGHNHHHSSPRILTVPQPSSPVLFQLIGSGGFSSHQQNWRPWTQDQSAWHWLWHRIQGCCSW